MAQKLTNKIRILYGQTNLFFTSVKVMVHVSLKTIDLLKATL